MRCATSFPRRVSMADITGRYGAASCRDFANAPDRLQAWRRSPKCSHQRRFYQLTRPGSQRNGQFASFSQPLRGQADGRDTKPAGTSRRIAVPRVQQPCQEAANRFSCRWKTLKQGDSLQAATFQLAGSRRHRAATRPEAAHAQANRPQSPRNHTRMLQDVTMATRVPRSSVTRVV